MMYEATIQPFSPPWPGRQSLAGADGGDIDSIDRRLRRPVLGRFAWKKTIDSPARLWTIIGAQAAFV